METMLKKKLSTQIARDMFLQRTFCTAKVGYLSLTVYMAHVVFLIFRTCDVLCFLPFYAAAQGEG